MGLFWDWENPQISQVVFFQGFQDGEKSDIVSSELCRMLIATSAIRKSVWSQFCSYHNRLHTVVGIYINTRILELFVSRWEFCFPMDPLIYPTPIKHNYHATGMKILPIFREKKKKPCSHDNKIFSFLGEKNTL